MGTDIHPVFQKKVVEADGSVIWEPITSRYGRDCDYFLFGWLANVCNGYDFFDIDTGDAVVPLSEPRGFPDDFNLDTDERDRYLGKWLGDHSYSWLTGEEIIKGLDNLSPVRKSGVLSHSQYHLWDKKSEPSEYIDGKFGPGIVTVRQGSEASKRKDTYSERIQQEEARFRASIRYVLKTKTKEVRVPINRRPDYDLTPSQAFGMMFDPFWSSPKAEDVAYTTVRRTTRAWVPLCSPSKLKHLAKLKRYSRRANKVYVECNWTMSQDDIRKEYAYFTDEIRRLMDEHGEIRMVFGFDS